MNLEDLLATGTVGWLQWLHKLWSVWCLTCCQTLTRQVFILLSK